MVMDALEQMYQEVILEESKSPYHKVYHVDDPHCSHQYNPSCGDDITLTVSLDENKSIRNIQWSGEGCSISMSSASILAQLLEGLTVDEALEKYDFFSELMDSRGEGLPTEKLDQLGDASVFVGTSKFPARIKCAMLSWAAFKGSLSNQI
jgi:nitrogen fixation NifU-like protein